MKIEKDRFDPILWCIMINRLPLILASASPRRKQLLTETGFVFETILPDANVEDERRVNESSTDYVRRLALQKAENIANKIERGIILGCDTVVLCGENILEKPIDRSDARRMLKKLRGEIHYVLSGICLLEKEIGVKTTALLETDITKLMMQPISDGEIETYLDTEKWRGKSGSFGYQDGIDWIVILEGSESNVVGLPMELFQAMYRSLKK